MHMRKLTLVAAAALVLASAAPAMAQPTDVGNMAYPNPSQTPAGRVGGSAPGGRDVGNMQERVPGSRAGYQTNTYNRRPSSRTPTDVGNMAFPDPSFTPAGNLPPVPVGR